MMSDVAIKKNDLPALNDWKKDAGMGFEEASSDEFKLPLIKIIYSSSMPDVEKTVDGKPVSEGCIYNQTSERAYAGEPGMLVVPCYYKRSFNEWAPLEDGNNRPVAVHKDKPEGTVRNGNKDELPNGNYVEDTGNWFVMILDSKYQVIEEGLITMKSTQKKKATEWLQKLKSNQIDGQTPPGYKCVYRLSTIRQKSGTYKYWGWQIRFDRFLEESDKKDATTYVKAKNFAHHAKEFNLYYGPESQEQTDNPNTKEAKEVPF